MMLILLTLLLSLSCLQASPSLHGSSKRLAITDEETQPPSSRQLLYASANDRILFTKTQFGDEAVLGLPNHPISQVYQCQLFYERQDLVREMHISYQVMTECGVLEQNYPNIELVKVYLSEIYAPFVPLTIDPVQVYEQLTTKFPEHVLVDVLDEVGYSISVYHLFVRKDSRFDSFKQYVSSKRFDILHVGMDGNTMVHFCMIFDLFRVTPDDDFSTVQCLQTVHDVGVDIDAPNALGVPPINIAAMLDDKEPLLFLISKRAEVNTYLPDHVYRYIGEGIVAKMRDPPIIDALLFKKYRTRKNIRSKLFSIVGQDCADLMVLRTRNPKWDMLIKTGVPLEDETYYVLATKGKADLTVTSIETGDTPLMLAIQARDRDFTQYLLSRRDARTFMSISNKKRETAWTHAIQQTDAKLLNMLESKGGGSFMSTTDANSAKPLLAKKTKSVSFNDDVDSSPPTEPKAEEKDAHCETAVDCTCCFYW